MGREVVMNIVSPITGEITNMIYEGDKILRKEAVEYLESTTEIGEDKGFIKMFIDNLLPLANERLTGNQFIIIMIMARYIRYESGLIAFDNGIAVSKDDIVKISGISRSTVYQVIEELVEKKIIGKNKVGNNIKYYFNPFIFAKGARINKTLYSMFENSKWKKYYDIDGCNTDKRNVYRKNVTRVSSNIVD